jgi:hypothetical protein
MADVDAAIELKSTVYNVKLGACKALWQGWLLFSDASVTFCDPPAVNFIISSSVGVTPVIDKLVNLMSFSR